MKGRRLLFGTFYRPPNSTPFILDCISDSISLAVDSGIENIVITGDFNLDLNKTPCRSKIDSLLQQFDLSQLINEPTHFTETSETILDLFLVTSSVSVLNSGVGEPFLDQQVRFHCPVYCVLNFSRGSGSTFKRKIWKYKDGDYAKLRDMVGTFDWTNCYSDDIDTHSTQLTNQLLSFCEITIPSKFVTIRTVDPPWFHNDLRKEIRRRRRAYKKAKSSNIDRHWTHYRQQRNYVNSLVKSAKESYFNTLAKTICEGKHSSSDYWKLLKRFTTQNTPVNELPPLIYNDTIYETTQDKANILNTFFQSQSTLTVPDGHLRISNSQVPDCPLLDDFVITRQDVIDSIKVLKTGKASGPDQVNSFVLKEIASEIAEPLQRLFNQSLTTSKVPLSWKFANVCAIHKKSDPQDVSNYRPISLLSVVCKVLERIVHKYIFNHYRTIDFLTSFQSGFRPKDSTVNQLVSVYHSFCQAVDSGKEVRAVFCDISKAFDRVWHEGLVHKLHLSGISGSLLSWLSNYLSDRRQCVVLSGCKSDSVAITAGVPQGSILGPLLFLVYINDIVRDIQSPIRLFADDTALFIIVDTPTEAATKLNADLSNIHSWAEKWLVTFNPSKTKSLIISKKTNRPFHPPLFFNDCQINEVESHTHLGVNLSNSCSWQVHIQSIKQKAWKRINLMRSFKFTLDRKSLLTIYTSFIRPIIEYSDVVWDNITNQDATDLERIQLEAARIITGGTRLASIQNLYDETHLEPLMHRRRKHKLTLFYKMFNSLTPSYLTALIPPNVGDRIGYQLRNSGNIRNISCKSEFFSRSFLPSTIDLWNSLPADVKSASSLPAFKSKLNKGKKTVPLHFYDGDRRLNILHARLRMHCSSLNEHLFSKNIVDSPMCQCGEIEDSFHYFFHCPLFNDKRAILFDNLSLFQPITLQLLLFGIKDELYDTNSTIFKHVQLFIRDTHRF